MKRIALLLLVACAFACRTGEPSSDPKTPANSPIPKLEPKDPDSKPIFGDAG